MSKAFIQLVEQAKKDTISSELLFKDTERFFKKTRVLRNTLNENSHSRKTSNK